jgi:TolB-like protein
MRTTAFALAALLCLPLSARAAPAAPAAPSTKPRLAFLELTPGPEVTKEVAAAAGEVLVVALSETNKFDVITKSDVKALLGYEAQAQMLGCNEASCMADLGGALGAAFLVSGSLGRLGGQLQLTLALIDTARSTAAKRASLAIDGANLQGGLREAVQRLTGEVVTEQAGPTDACASPPCTREAVTALKRWWEKEWDAIPQVGVIPDGPVDQLLHEGKPARIFRFVVRTRARTGERSEYLAYIRFKKVEGDWYFDQGSMRHLRNLPLASKPDEPPKEGELQKLLADGFAATREAAKGKAKVTKVEAARFPDYQKTDTKAEPKDQKAPGWQFTFSVTYEQGGKTTLCHRAEATLRHEGKGWKYEHGRDFTCEEVLDPN